MKAKVKATGKVVEVQKIIEYLEKPGTSFGGDYEYYIDEANKKIYQETELEFENVYPDLQQIRIQASIAALKGLCSNSNHVNTEENYLIEKSIRLADKLVEKLQKEMEVNNE